MLYEYPDEFIVEVVYMDILDENNEKIDLQTRNNSYNSLFQNKLLFGNSDGIKEKWYKKNTKHKKDEYLLEKNRDTDDNIFEDFIKCGLIEKSDVKNYLVDMGLWDELDNEYAVSEMKEK